MNEVIEMCRLPEQKDSDKADVRENKNDSS